MINEYDEIKELLRRSRRLTEQVAPPVNIMLILKVKKNLMPNHKKINLKLIEYRVV